MAATTHEVPFSSLEQRRQALLKANRIRMHRAKLKRDLAAGRRQVAVVLLEPEPELETMKVLPLLTAAPKIGNVKANKMLRDVHVSPTKQLGTLPVRQRLELVQRVAAVGRR